MTEVAKARLVVRGRVQGVFYRESTKETARQLGLAGWVKNQDDGTVALEAVGPRDKVEKLIKWCEKGPPSARVDGIDVQWMHAEPHEAADSFTVLR